MNSENGKTGLRVGVIFGGRSSEHEVSLASARNVMEALRTAGHEVVPIGITRVGRWLPHGDPLRLLTAESGGDTEPATQANGSQAAAPGEVALASSSQDEGAWALLPRPAQGRTLPAVDILFPVLHGPFGEDGTIQGMLEMANIPYVGCGVLASAVCMDKALARRLFASAGLPQPAWRELLRTTWREKPEQTLDWLEREMGGYPLFIKPANLGSSVGISKARDRDELAAALDLAARYDRRLIVEQAVPHAREIEVSVLGNEEPVASVPGEILPGAEFYDYAAKYLDDTSQLLIPAPLEPETAARIRAMAVQAFRVVDGAGLARVDFLLDEESGQVYLNEINTMPGFTRISMYPKLWEATGISYPDLVDRLVRLGFERFTDRQQNETSRA